MDTYTINRGFSIIKSKIRKLELEAIKKNNLDVSDIQWNYLIRVMENRNMKLSDLAKKLGVQKGTLSNNIKILLSKKLIKKEKTNNKTTLNATEKGIKYIKIHKKTRALMEKALRKVISEEELNTLIKIGIKIQDNL